MADEKDLSKKIGLTPGKMGLIGVLAVVLVGVIYIQFGSGDREEVVADSEETVELPPPRSQPQLPKPEANATVVGAPAATDETSSSKSAASQSSDLVVWKAPDVASIVQYDPFALPSAFPQPPQKVNAQGLTSEGIVAADAATRASQLADAVAKLQSDLASLQNRGVSVIIKQHDQYVAMIGDRTLHVGDEINGFTITAIEPDGVRVEKKVQQ